MSTPVTNFPKVQVSIGYDAVATSIALTGGHGSRLPSTFPYPLSWWDATTYSDPTDDPNKEIVIVTNRVGDTLTVTRAGEGTAASTKNTAGKTYKMVEGITKAMWDSLFTLSLSQSFRGLAMQTHPDSDKVFSQVLLLHADAITMDDGQEIKTWDMLACDFTASGAGGLDTGAETASVWYELYAIYNPTTATKKLMAHRAKDWFLDQDASAGDDGAVALRDAAARTKLAQGFKTTNAGLVEFVDIKVLKTGAPVGNFWLTIEANNAGVPSGTPLATSDKFDVSRLQTAAMTLRIPFRTPVSLSAATQYHLVLQGDFTIGAADMSWRADTTAPTYANGTAATFDGATWTADAAKDFTFKLYVTRNDVAVTMPSGYTQKALVGYAYNDASSNLVRFRQANRKWKYGQVAADGQLINELPAATTSYDMRVLLPALNLLMAMLTGTGTGAAAANIVFSDFTGTDTIAGTVAGTQFGVSINATTEVPANSVEVPISYALIIIDGTSGADVYVSGFEF